MIEIRPGAAGPGVRSLAAAALLLVGMYSLPGCAVNYVTDDLPEVWRYSQMKPVENAVPVSLSLEGRLDGKKIDGYVGGGAPRIWTNLTKAILNSSQVVTVVDDEDKAAAGHIHLIVDLDWATQKKAMGRAVWTGLTFGLVGLQEVRAFKLTGKYTRPGGEGEIVRDYHSKAIAHFGLIGRGTPRYDAIAGDPDTIVFERFIWSFLRDIQKAGAL